MKATGIVRRIDDLGRVVIPKEIRRTLRLRDGEPLEIFTSSAGEVIFKKYSPIGEIGELTGCYIQTLHRMTGLLCAICDKDHITASAGLPRKELEGRRICPQIEQILAERQNRIELTEPIPAIEETEYRAFCVFPILENSDITGALLILDNGSKAAPSESELRLAQLCVNLLVEQLN